MFKNTPYILNFGSYDASISHKNMQMTPKRTVNLFEFEIATEDGGISFIDGEEYPVKKQNIILAKPAQERRTMPPYKCLYLHIMVEDTEIARQLCMVPNLFQSADAKKYERVIKRIIAHCEEVGEVSKFRVTGELFELFAMLIGEQKIQKFKIAYGDKNSQIIKKAQFFIEENYSQGITLADIASYVNMSKIYFHNLFIAATGLSTHRYILEKRLAKVKSLLMTNEKSIAEIALECGFSSQSYLNYIFKKECGLTPRAYIKKMSEVWEAQG